MNPLYVVAMCVVWWVVYSVGKDMLDRETKRREARIWIRWELEEMARAEAWAHRRRLAAIETARLNTIRELDRIAAEAKGEVIEGNCREVTRR